MKIKELRKALELTQTEFATKIGVTMQSVQNWENGRSEPNQTAVSAILKTFGVSPAWLLSGEGNMFSSSGKLIAASEDDENTVNYIFRPDIYASAGVGYVNETEDEISTLKIDEQIARRLGIRKEIEIIQVRGDSMTPKYNDKDLLFVDRGDNQFTSEGIYALLYDGTLMVKYLQRIKQGIRIRSLNRSMYDDIDFEADEFTDNRIYIVGRVKGAMTFN